MRREEFSTGQTSTDPKYGITYSPLEWLTLRATQSEAFIAPSLEQLFAPEVCGLSSVTDRFGPWDAFTSRCSGGNPVLKNESSESQQFGVDLVFDAWDTAAVNMEPPFAIALAAPGQLIMDICFRSSRVVGSHGRGSAGQQPRSTASLMAFSACPGPRIVRTESSLHKIPIMVRTGSSMRPPFRYAL